MLLWFDVGLQAGMTVEIVGQDITVGVVVGDDDDDGADDEANVGNWESDGCVFGFFMILHNPSQYHNCGHRI
jgi:hypothetical protein